MSSGALTVSDFIDLPIIRAALPDLVAGQAGLEAEVRWVHTLDVPDVSNLLRGGEMILTTGSSIGSDAAAQRRFVRDLAAEGAVGVAVELGFATLNGIPGEVCREEEGEEEEDEKEEEEEMEQYPGRGGRKTADTPVPRTGLLFVKGQSEKRAGQRRKRRKRLRAAD